MQIEHLKDLLQWSFEKIFENNKNITNSSSFPYPVKVAISLTHPEVLNLNIKDLLHNYFSVSDLQFIRLESICQNKTIFISVGHNSVKIINNDYYATSNQKEGIRILPIGSKDITQFIQQNLQAKYQFFSSNITFDFAEFVKQSCCNYSYYYQDESDMSIQQKYEYDYVQYVQKLQNIKVPHFKLDNINERAMSSNFIGDAYVNTVSKYAFIETSLQFKQLFNQQQIIELNEFGKRARSTTIQKLINLAKVQNPESLASLELEEQLKSIKISADNQLQILSSEIKQFERKKQIQSMFESALEKVDFGDTYIDIQKLQNHLYAQYNELNQCSATCSLQLNDLGVGETTMVQFPPIYYFNSGAASINGNVIIPIVGEQIVAQESYFNPQLINLNCVGVIEGIRACLPGYQSFSIALVGASFPGMAQRIFEDCSKFGCIEVQAVDEYDTLSKFILNFQ
eukprot:EST48500.1 Hypothetical protein SS50377_11308 [Spironucleus salmonicida]